VGLHNENDIHSFGGITVSKPDDEYVFLGPMVFAWAIGFAAGGNLPDEGFWIPLVGGLISALVVVALAFYVYTTYEWGD